MRDLLRLIAFQLGGEDFLYEELGKQLGMSKTTVEKYLDLLEKVFVIYRLGAYSRKPAQGGYKSWQVVLLRQRHSQCHYRGFLTAGHSAGCRCAVGELHHRRAAQSELQ